MCNRYRPPNPDDIRHRWLREPQSNFPPGPWSEVFPRKQGLILRPGSTGALELIEARWQLVPSYHRKPLDQFKLSTNNARWEDKVRTSPTFKPSWVGGRRCLIPTAWFNERTIRRLRRHGHIHARGKQEPNFFDASTTIAD
jgi:putative SOS response-associated peptidase YedK